MALNTNLNVDSAISQIGSQAGTVNGYLNQLMDENVLKNPEQMIAASMHLMQEQQKLTTMTEGFTKSMKAAADAAKAAITNMH